MRDCEVKNGEMDNRREIKMQKAWTYRPTPCEAQMQQHFPSRDLQTNGAWFAPSRVSKLDGNLDAS